MEKNMNDKYENNTTFSKNAKMMSDLLRGCDIIGVKIFRGDCTINEAKEPDERLTWCQAVQMARKNNEAFIINKNTIDCPGASIALGLVDPYSKEKLGVKQYKGDMEGSPYDFSMGYVYACAASGNPEFHLFGKDTDPGRYNSLESARNAIAGMPRLQQGTSCVVPYPPSLDIDPDVVLAVVNSKQAMRLIQAQAWDGGNRFHSSTIGIRGVCADSVAYPLLNNTLNVTFFCLGARVLGKFKADECLAALPYTIMGRINRNLEESDSGFPLDLMP
ncbi:MAG: DUF169 domain-containing protein [Candidatus Methanoperedens sp.]|nr:DUF169 domain-containing protein [Candidatus Methanoperedens sp.]